MKLENRAEKIREKFFPNLPIGKFKFSNIGTKLCLVTYDENGNYLLEISNKINRTGKKINDAIKLGFIKIQLCREKEEMSQFEYEQLFLRKARDVSIGRETLGYELGGLL